MLGCGLVDGDPRRHPLAHAAHGVNAVNRLLDELKAGGGERLDRAHSLLDGPRPVRVQPQCDGRAGRGARRSHAARVVAHAHLHLHAREARARRSSRLVSDARAVERRHGRVDRDLPRGVVGEQLGDRLSLRAPGAVPQRQVDRGERGRQVIHAAAGVDQLGSVRARHPRKHRAVALECRLYALHRDAVIGLKRRGLAVAGQPRRIGQRHGQQLALGDRSVGALKRGRELQRAALDAQPHRDLARVSRRGRRARRRFTSRCPRSRGSRPRTAGRRPAAARPCAPGRRSGRGRRSWSQPRSSGAGRAGSSPK